MALPARLVTIKAANTGPNLPGERQADHRAGLVLGAKVAEAVDELKRQHPADEERGQRNDENRANTDELHRLDEEPARYGGRTAQKDGLAEEARERPKLGERRQEQLQKPLARVARRGSRLRRLLPALPGRWARPQARGFIPWFGAGRSGIEVDARDAARHVRQHLVRNRARCGRQVARVE